MKFTQFSFLLAVSSAYETEVDNAVSIQSISGHPFLKDAVQQHVNAAKLQPNVDTNESLNSTRMLGKASKKGGGGTRPKANKRSKASKPPSGGPKCKVTVTNLSYEQSFGDIFVMVHNDMVQDKNPMFEEGSPASEEFAELAQNLDADPLFDYYKGKPGVNMVKTITDFGLDRKYLDGGAKIEFNVDRNSNYNKLTLAAGFPFANDGVAALQGVRIIDGAEYVVEALDAGVEANLQTCWSVPAEREDFPPRSACADEDHEIGDANDNSLPGEGFVHTHRGIHDVDVPTDVYLLKCNDVEQDSTNHRFVEYFMASNYNDEDLLCSAVKGLGDCNMRSDDDFIGYVKGNGDLANPIFDLVRDSDDYNDFCDKIEGINDSIESAFVTLEPTIFDFRNPIAKVKISC
jgi:hypothetical protein